MIILARDNIYRDGVAETVGDPKMEDRYLQLLQLL